MSLDAMEWVWEHSRARGVARLVLLAIADRAAGRDCTAYAGTTMLVRRAGAARSSVIAAVDKLTDAGELEIVPRARGPRGETCYRLPHAAAYVAGLPDSAASGSPVTGGPKTGPVQNPDRRSPDPRGTESGPEGSENRTGGGTETGPPHQTEHNQETSSAHARASQPTVPRDTTPDAARPLMTALTAAGVDVAWRLTAGEWTTILAAEQSWGRDALVQAAVERTAGRNVRSARYLLAIWRDPANFPGGAAPEAFTAAPGTNVVPLRRASHTDNLRAGLELLEGREESR
jgi:hypothetical protein